MIARPLPVLALTLAVAGCSFSEHHHYDGEHDAERWEDCEDEWDDDDWDDDEDDWDDDEDDWDDDEDDWDEDDDWDDDDWDDDCPEDDGDGDDHHDDDDWHDEREAECEQAWHELRVSWAHVEEEGWFWLRAARPEAREAVLERLCGQAHELVERRRELNEECPLDDHGEGDGEWEADDREAPDDREASDDDREASDDDRETTDERGSWMDRCFR